LARATTGLSHGSGVVALRPDVRRTCRPHRVRVRGRPSAAEPQSPAPLEGAGRHAARRRQRAVRRH
jgi:hypothetical protein